MAWIDDGNGGWRWVQRKGEQGDPGAIPAPTGPAPRRKIDPTPEQTSAAVESARLNYQHAVWNPAQGSYTFVPMSAVEQDQAKLDQAQAANTPVSTPDLPTAAAALPSATPAAPRTLDALRAGLAAPSARLGFQADPGAAAFVRGTPLTTQAAPATPGLKFDLPPDVNPDGTPKPLDPLNRAKIDPLLQGINSYGAQIGNLAGDQTGESVAQAQLLKSDKLAQLRAADELRNSQSATLGAARSARNRGDTALLERQAVGESAYLGQESQRQDVLRQAELEGNQAILRAGEEDADRRFRLDALKTAADLGLNTAALEVDVSKANLAAASDYINNQFQQVGIDKQIDQQQSAMLLNFARDMEALKFQYAQLTEQEQEALVASELQKYGIDKNVELQHWATKQGQKPDWLGFAGGLLGAGIGAAATVAKSDRRAKTQIADTTDEDLESLLGSLKSQTFRYKSAKDGVGRNLGVMAQDLQKTDLGSTMVSKGPDADLQVDTGKAGLAALSGLALVYDKLKKIEAAL